MKTAPGYDEHPADLVGGHTQAPARGRFGREVRPAPAADDAQIADARTTMQTDRARKRFETADYEIDADAVASAIVHRLLAGRTLAPARRDAR